MSVIRFVHTDALRLGSPLAGLSDSPDWLRKTASSAIRTAVTNTIEVAIASRCQFLLIAGRICESSQDLDLAIGWLRAQSGALREHGIRLVLAGHPATDHPALGALDAIVVGPGQRLDVRLTETGRAELTVTTTSLAARSGGLVIEVSSTANSPQFMATRHHNDLTYFAIPALNATSGSSADGTTMAHDRLLKISAGSPQAVSSQERGAFGCQLVEADPARQSLVARFCPTDVIRYSQVLLNCLAGTPFEKVCELLRDRSRSIATADRCTTIVEWVLDGDFTWNFDPREAGSELALLQELRSGLNAGHSGAWPGRIRLADSCTVAFRSETSPTLRELSNVLADRSHTPSRAMHHDSSTSRSCHGSDALTALSLLRRVA